MATFEIPAEPTVNRVWLLDHPELGGPLQASRMGNNAWDLHVSATSEERLSWAELLELGTVTDVDPHDVSWIPSVPWSTRGDYVNDANEAVVLEMYSSIGPDRRARLAALITQLVNEHVARHAGGAS